MGKFHHIIFWVHLQFHLQLKLDKKKSAYATSGAVGKTKIKSQRTQGKNFSLYPHAVKERKYHMFPKVEKLYNNAVHPARLFRTAECKHRELADWNSSTYSAANRMTIASPVTIGNWTTLTILAHNGSSPYKPNSHITLTEETTIEGYTFPALTKITFNDRGRLNRLALPSDGVLNGIRFKSYPYKIEFWEGKLFNGTIAGDQVI